MKIKINWKAIYSATTTIVAFALAQHLFPAYSAYLLAASSILTLWHNPPTSLAGVVGDAVKSAEVVEPLLP